MKRIFRLVYTLSARLQRLVYGLLIAVGLASSDPANAAINEAAIQRVDDIRQRLLEADADHGLPPANQANGTLPPVAQWHNWPNWKNWSDWRDWANW